MTELYIIARLAAIESDLEGACRVLPGLICTQENIPSDNDTKRLAAFNEMLAEIWSEVTRLKEAAAAGQEAMPL